MKPIGATFKPQVFFAQIFCASIAATINIFNGVLRLFINFHFLVLH